MAEKQGIIDTLLSRIEKGRKEILWKRESNKIKKIAAELSETDGYFRDGRNIFAVTTVHNGFNIKVYSDDGKQGLYIAEANNRLDDQYTHYLENLHGENSSTHKDAVLKMVEIVKSVMKKREKDTVKNERRISNVSKFLRDKLYSVFVVEPSARFVESTDTDGNKFLIKRSFIKSTFSDSDYYEEVITIGKKDKKTGDYTYIEIVDTNGTKSIVLGYHSEKYDQNFIEQTNTIEAITEAKKIVGEFVETIIPKDEIHKKVEEFKLKLAKYFGAEVDEIKIKSKTIYVCIDPSSERIIISNSPDEYRKSNVECIIKLEEDTIRRSVYGIFGLISVPEINTKKAVVVAESMLNTFLSEKAELDENLDSM